MDDATAEKIARNDSTFRDANNEIEGAAIDYGLDPAKPIPFICECSNERCTEIISITLEEYMRVRSDPRWFAHAPGHEESIDGAVRLVERTPRFVLVEKIQHAGAKATELADHRPEA